MGLDHGLVRGKNCFCAYFFRDISLKNRSSSVYHLDRLPQGLCELCFKKNISFYGKEGVLYTPKKYRPHSGDFDIGRVSNDTVNTGECATFHRVVVCATGGDSVG